MYELLKGNGSRFVNWKFRSARMQYLHLDNSGSENMPVLFIQGHNFNTRSVSVKLCKPKGYAPKPDNFTLSVVQTGRREDKSMCDFPTESLPTLLSC